MVNNMEESFSQHYEDLKQYIKNAINFGQSREEIERNLINAGWQKEVIDRAFLEIEQIQAQGNQSAYQTPQGAYSWQQTSSFEAAGEDKKGFAVASFILGCISLILGVFSKNPASIGFFALISGSVAAIPGVILGALGLHSSKRKFAIAGIIFSIVFLILVYVTTSLILIFDFFRHKEPDEGIVSKVMGLESIVRNYYSSHGTYNGFDKDKEFLILENNIKKEGTELLVYIKDKEYCAKAFLPKSKEWYCADVRTDDYFKQEPPCSSTHYSCK